MKWLVIICLLMLAACDPAPGPALPQAPAQDTCGAGAHAGLKGRDATALEKVYILGQVRMIRPGQPYTEDLRPQRLNFVVDEAGRIARIYCG